MRCEVCGRIAKEVEGVYLVDGKWLHMKANYCFKHGSFLSKAEIENAEEVKFSMADADPNAPHYRSKNYRTCRNWQFAYKISKLL